MTLEGMRGALLCGIASAALPWSGTVLAQEVTAQQQMAVQSADTVLMDQPAEQVLITGSLIHGAVAVGVPVTNIKHEDFVVSGALTIGDIFKDLPSAIVTPAPSVTQGGANSERGQAVNLHGLDSAAAARSLLLVDGMRYPATGHKAAQVDPSIVPAIAIDRLDVLVDGASATYGSDAVSGVINIILKRGYDGALTQLTAGTARGGGATFQASQLWGRTWDGGDVTVSYEWYDQAAIPGSKRSETTFDFSPWGLDDRTSIQSSLPGTVSTGAPTAIAGAPAGFSATLGTQYCGNCYSVPKGQNGIGLTWATLSSAQNNGIHNEFNPYLLSWATAGQQRNAATITLDQRLTPEVEFFADAFYSNRRAQLLFSAAAYGSAFGTYTVPTTNPYYPIGAPAGLRVSYSFAYENPPVASSYELASHYDFGANLRLPFDWNGKIVNSESEENSQTAYKNLQQTSAVSAALGATVTSVVASGTTPGIATFTKPAGIPYLNLFCDPTVFTCNSPDTLSYVAGYHTQSGHTVQNEKAVNFDGPLIDLPSGTVRAAVGASLTKIHTTFIDDANYNQPSPVPKKSVDSESRSVWAVFGQLNVPLVDDLTALPAIRKLELEASWRYDHYDDVGDTTNPKVALNWAPLESVTFRGTWGTSFRAPSFGEVSSVTNAQTRPTNASAGGVSGDTIPVACVGGVPVPGSAAAATGAPCGSFPGGITVQGGAGNASVLRGGNIGAQPEHARNYGIGAEFAPTEFLKGLDLSVTYYRVKIVDVLAGFPVTSASFNDPNAAFTFITPDGPNGVGATAFAELVAATQRLTNSQVIPSLASNVKWINDGATRNAGYIKQDGIDFNGSYDWDMGDWGDANVGIAGTYGFHSITFSGIAGSLPLDAYHQDSGSGAVLAHGVSLSPRFAYRAHVSLHKENWTLTGFVNYQSHFFNNQASPPLSLLTTFPDYSNLVPSYYTFDLSLGYTTGDTPMKAYMRDIGIQLVVQNITDRRPPFAYNITTGTGNPSAFDTTKSDIGRFTSVILTKAW